MNVVQLRLKNFRNIQDSVLNPSHGINFLFGANGQGKTSFLEALGLLSTLRSFRESKTQHLIKWGAADSEISCTLSHALGQEDPWRTDLRLYFHWMDSQKEKAAKVAFINSKPFKSSTLFLSQRFGSTQLGFHCVIFNPSDHDLVRGDPSVRRSFMDRVIAAENIEYLKNLQKYQRVLSQRNALLKRPDLTSKGPLLEFNQQLIGYGASLTLERLKWIQRANLLLNETLKRIAPQQPALELEYLSQWIDFCDKKHNDFNNLYSIHFTGQAPLPSLELLEQSFSRKVSSLEAAEWKAGHSLVGPHRDDWMFLLGKQALKGHGSQGEVRSALLSLKLTELELFLKATGHRPLFLLDDFSSELDDQRRSFLLKYLVETELQTFITTTDESKSVGKKFWIINGKVEEGQYDGRRENVRSE
jgi:DNA replication and repair protein RecF